MIENEIEIAESMGSSIKKIFHNYIYKKKCDFCKTRDSKRGLISFPIKWEDTQNINKLSQLGIDFIDCIIITNCPRGAVKPICTKCDSKLFSKIQKFSGTHSLSIDFTKMIKKH